MKISHKDKARITCLKRSLKLMTECFFLGMINSKSIKTSQALYGVAKLRFRRAAKGGLYLYGDVLLAELVVIFAWRGQGLY